MKCEDLKKLRDAFYNNKVVVITGAGISTLSGIPDFRGKNGLYNKNIDAERYLSYNFFKENPLEFYKFYSNYMMINNYKPNFVHTFLSDLENAGHIKGIITQNIDKLHQKAGSKNVVDLHGDGSCFKCVSCNLKYDSSEYLRCSGICPDCGSYIKPDIILYGEDVAIYNMWKSKSLISSCDVLIVLGSSLVVSTASDLVKEFIHLNKLKNNLNDKLFIVNNNETPYDYFSNKYEDDLGKVLKKIL